MCAAAIFENTALYVHIPFCRGICAYCDFTRVGYHAGLADRYLTQLDNELGERVGSQAIRTVYIGGGTPTALSEKQRQKLFNMLQPYIRTAQEVTMEANPESVDEALACQLRHSGINRVSLGLQAADDAMLQKLGRQHSFAQAEQAVKTLKAQGLTNLSVDLMYSLPGQTLAQWQNTLDKALLLGVPHLSLYSLTIEEHSEFGRRGVHQLDEQTEAEMYFEAVRRLEQAGYDHYEISNFARPGYASQHNLQYWQYHDFWGVGLGASGKLGCFRYDNTRSFEAYFKGQWIGEKINLSRRDQMFEMVMMNLRTREGLALAAFEQAFGQPVTEVYPAAVGRNIDQGRLILTPEALKPTPQGMALLNSVLEEFLD